MPGGGAGYTDNGELAEPDFHHPLEVMVEKAVDGEDVVSALMVGDENVGCFRVDIFPSLDFHAHECEPGAELRPDVRGPVTEEFASENQREDDRDQSGKDCQNHNQRNHHQELVNSVQYVYDNFHASEILEM